MNFSEHPITDLADCIAHAQYVGFSDIKYEDRDWQHYRDTGEHKGIARTRRPTTRDFEVYAMFPQVWGSTALGHGGIGGSAMTSAYTVVLCCPILGEFLVYFGGRFCYAVDAKSKNIHMFFEDCRNNNLASKQESEKYQ